MATPGAGELPQSPCSSPPPGPRPALLHTVLPQSPRVPVTGTLQGLAWLTSLPSEALVGHCFSAGQSTELSGEAPAPTLAPVGPTLGVHAT